MRIIKSYNSRFFDGESGMYLDKITLVDVQNSEEIVMPYYAITSIAINNTGSAVVYLTNDSETDIAGGTATWTAWDGVSEINNAITGIKSENTTGTSVITISVQTVRAK